MLNMPEMRMYVADGTSCKLKHWVHFEVQINVRSNTIDIGDTSRGEKVVSVQAPNRDTISLRLEAAGRSPNNEDSDAESETEDEDSSEEESKEETATEESEEDSDEEESEEDSDEDGKTDF
ncbi:hypothetical protein LTR85_004276 [Meristemomyces frigidus]|nr:hypothetical protein LTR85_004276 [Meristemomyces frigidus]